MEINKVYCENNLETMARMPDDFIDLTVTSPPYDDMDENFNPIKKNGLRDYNGYDWNFKKIAEELFRVTKPGGVVVWVVNDPTIKGSESLASCYQKIYFRKVGFNIETMIWNKPAVGACGSNYFYWQAFEYMIIACKGNPKISTLIKDKKNKHAGRNRIFAPNGFRGDRNGIIIKNFGTRTNVWNIGVGIADNSDRTIHPAIFPEQLANDHIISWSNESDLIYDPFMGSGTVAKMAIKLKRNWIGSEISKEYCDIAIKRISMLNNNYEIFA